MTRISPPVRIFALVAILVAVAFALMLSTMARGGDIEPVALAPAAERTPLAQGQAKAAPRVTSGVSAAKPTPAPARAKRATPAPAKPASGLPRSVDAALKRHAVVVVSLYLPGARLDRVAAAEAKAGAGLAGAGFVALDLTKEREAQPLLEKLGVLTPRSVLVFRRPGELALNLSGFADRETVAQAAANAAS